MKKVVKKCDKCGTDLYLDDKYGRKHFKFCPNCGTDSDAQMKIKKGSALRRWFPFILTMAISVGICYLFYIRFPMSVNEGMIEHIQKYNLEFLLFLFIPDILILRDILTEPVCTSCRNAIRQSFRFCPFCGIKKSR